VASATDAISDDLAIWMRGQPMFFVATAPRADDGHVNVSPKGLATFAVLGPQRVAYLDLTGSGAETIAHVRQNGRITIMFCAFEGAPSICRVYGAGTVHERGSDGYDELLPNFTELVGARAIIDVAVTRVSSSCGYGVPLMEYVGQRTRLLEWADARGPEGLADYRRTKNAASIDGLPAFGAEQPASQ
jgi:hypothetical protein